MANWKHMDISQITENLYIASRIKTGDIDAVLQLESGLIISMIVQRRPPKALTTAGLEAQTPPPQHAHPRVFG